MNLNDLVAGMVMLILVYLLVANARGSSQVIEALSKGVGSTVRSLQGRD